jgi:hypothetical protein
MTANHSFLNLRFHIFSTAMSTRDRVSPHFLHNEADSGAGGTGQAQPRFGEASCCASHRQLDPRAERQLHLLVPAAGPGRPAGAGRRRFEPDQLRPSIGTPLATARCGKSSGQSRISRSVSSACVSHECNSKAHQLWRQRCREHLRTKIQNVETRCSAHYENSSVQSRGGAGIERADGKTSRPTLLLLVMLA